MVTAGNGELARWLSVAVLLLVASGWRPRFTGVLHWYVAFSLMANVSILDGGDQVTTVLTLLLVPVTLTDPRRWHWQSWPRNGGGIGRVVGYTGMVLIQIQVVLEFALAVALLLRPPLRRYLLIAGIAFHGLIAITMGLISFSTAMTAALLLYLLPIGHQVALPAWAHPLRARAKQRVKLGERLTQAPV